MVIFWPRTLLLLPSRRADEDEAGDPFPGFDEGSAHILVIAGPARQPSARKAQRMSRMEQVHDRRATRHFLFPKRDLAAIAWRGKRSEQCRRLMGEPVPHLSPPPQLR